MRRFGWLLGFLVILVPLFMTGDSTTSRSLPAEANLDDPLLREIDNALFQKVALLDVQVDFPRPPGEAERLLARMAEGASPDPRVLEALAGVQIRLLEFEKAESTMRRLAETNPDKEKGLVALADYYHARLNIGEELKALDRLATLQKGKEKVATYTKILSLSDRHLIKDFDGVKVIRKIMAAEPNKAAHVELLISRLIENGRFRDALDEADKAVARFPGERRSFLRLKSDILVKDGKKEDALAIYRFSYDPVDDLDIFSDYLTLLRRLDRYTPYERGLRRRARLGHLDDDGRREHFLLMRNQRNHREAGKALDSWIESLGPLSDEQLAQFGRAYTAIGHTQAAWRLTYTRFFNAASAKAKEKALEELFDLTWKLKGSQQNLTGRGIRTYFHLRHFDTDPGVVGGLLSLLYNKQGVAGKIEDLYTVSRDYENRKILARIFAAYKSDYPDSPGLARMYAYAVRMFNEYNWPRTALRYAEQFMQSYPEDQRYYEVGEEAIASLRRIGDKGKIYEMYRSLIRRADSRGERDSYLKYLSSLVQAYVGNRLYTNVVQLYWDEINLHPEEETLYERFLSFLGRYKIYDEELKVYKQAIEHFADKGYHHKLARWYIRQRRQADFQDLTREIAGIFGESELSEFFNSFLEFGRDASYPDSVFYRTMYEYANRRFPRNMRFVNGLLDFYYRFKLWDEYDSLSKKYFYASGAIRENWLRGLSRRDKLNGAIQALTADQGLPLKPDAAFAETRMSQSPAELLFLAEAARWTSRFEAALPLFNLLVDKYPGQKELLTTLAELSRSFEHSGEATALYDRLSLIYPNNKDYLTKAGEVLIESGNTEQAAKRWEKIFEINPTNENLYLEVASIFWDYYQFSDAAEALLLARKNLKKPSLFGSKLAAVYESAKDYPKAVAEYVRTIALSWDSYWQIEEPLNRLKYLATRKGMAGEIDAAFEAAIRAESEDPRYTQGYASYLERMGKKEKRLELLRDSINRYENLDFLGRLADIFRDARDSRAEERTLQRLIQLSGENLENLLALANFYERNKRPDEAETILRKRISLSVTDEPEGLGDYLSALDDAANFAWRHERFDRAFDWWETAAKAATGYTSRRRLLALSERYIQRGRYARASEILEDLLTKEPSSTAYFNTLAQIYTRQQDYKGLAALNRRAIEAVSKDAGLSSEVKKSRIANLRLNLIENLKRLGDYTAALDQYIEIINRDYESTATLADAYRFAEKHGLTDRLVSYYQSTSEKSFKDFRWNVVLARLSEQMNKLPDAADQWTKAIRSEPQRIPLRISLADVYLKLQKYAEAVEVYREIYRLEDRNDSWILTIAKTQALSGDMEAARATLELLLEGRPPNYRKYFEVARILEGWGELEAAILKLDLGLVKLREDIYRERLLRDDLALYLRVGVKLGRVVEVFNNLLDLNAQYSREASRKGNRRAWEARQGQQLTYNAFSGFFAESLKNFATDAQRREIAQRLQGYLDQNPENEGTIIFVRQAAESMGFATVTERAIQADIGRLNKHRTRYDYRRAIMQGLRYYERRGQWREAARMMERELSRSTMYHFRPEMLSVLAELYRFGGDSEKELSALRRYWENSGGSNLGFNREDATVERYFTLLLEDGRESDLREAAQKVNAFSGQAVNFFLSHNRADLAGLAIDAAALRRSPKWRDSKKLLLRAYAGASSDAVGAHSSADSLMSAIPIGERLDRTPDKNRILLGGEWYGYVIHFVEYLHTAEKDLRYKGFLLGPAEGNSRDAEGQRQIARWYAKHKLYDDALRHYDLALQLKGGLIKTYSEKGELLFKKGDKAAAMQTWGKIIEGSRNSGSYEAYFTVLSRNGLKREAAEGLLVFLQKAFAESYYYYDFGYLLEDAVEALKEEGDYSPVVRSISKAASEAEEPVDLYRFLLDSLNLPETLQLEFYKLLIAHLENQLPGGEVDEYNEARSVARHWLERAIEFAVKQAEYDTALAWVEKYETNKFHENPTYQFRNDGYYWQLKARGLFAVGKSEEANQALRKIYEKRPLDLGVHQAAYKILLDAGEKPAAEDLMIMFYRNALSMGAENSANFTGLASILLNRAAEEKDATARKNSIDEALGLLDRMVNLTANNKQGMSEAARLLESKDHKSAALRYRRMLYRLDPLDFANTLALAALERTGGDVGKALRLYRELLTGTGVARKFRLDAMQPYIDLVADQLGSSPDETAVFEKRKDLTEIDRLVYAELVTQEGREELFKEALDAGMQTFMEPALLAEHRARQAIKSGDIQKAISDLRVALRGEPNAARRLALLKVLLKNDKPEEALLLLDEYGSLGLSSPQSDRLSAALGVKGEELLTLYGDLVQAAMDTAQYPAAEAYERHRQLLAKKLEKTVGSRLEEITKLRLEAKLPEPPIRIIDQIAN